MSPLKDGTQNSGAWNSHIYLLMELQGQKKIKRERYVQILFTENQRIILNNTNSQVEVHWTTICDFQNGRPRCTLTSYKYIKKWQTKVFWTSLSFRFIFQKGLRPDPDFKKQDCVLLFKQISIIWICTQASCWDWKFETPQWSLSSFAQ